MAPKNNHDPTTSDSGSGSATVPEADLREMEDVNQSLDALSCALDAFEQRTDDIMTQLRELLDSNREIRRELAQEKDQQDDEDDDDEDSDDDDDRMDVQQAEHPAQPTCVE